MVKTMQNRKYSLEVIAAWFQALGVDFVVAAHAAGGDNAKVVQAFQDCKARAKVNFRKLAFELHPDRQGGDEDRFKQLTDIWNRLKGIEIRPRPQQATFIVILHRYRDSRVWPDENVHTDTTTSTNDSWRF